MGELSFVIHGFTPSEVDIFNVDLSGVAAIDSSHTVDHNASTLIFNERRLVDLRDNIHPSFTK